MKREILFRGKSINGKWHEGLLSKIEEDYYISNSAGKPLAYQVRFETVGQFTGLRDKDGKRLYEGDFGYDEEGVIGQVMFAEYEDEYGNCCGLGWHLQVVDNVREIINYPLDVMLAGMMRISSNIHDTE